MLLCKHPIICSTEGCSVSNSPLVVQGGMLHCKPPVIRSLEGTHASSFCKTELLGWFSCNLLMEQMVLLWVWSLQGKPSLCWERACPKFARVERGMEPTGWPGHSDTCAVPQPLATVGLRCPKSQQGFGDHPTVWSPVPSSQPWRDDVGGGRWPLSGLISPLAHFYSDFLFFYPSHRGKKLKRAFSMAASIRKRS